MKQLDIFGNETDVNELETKTIKSKFRSVNGVNKEHMCKECKHFEAISYNGRNYYKCAKIGISSSSATDIRLKDYACGLFVRNL